MLKTLFVGFWVLCAVALSGANQVRNPGFEYCRNGKPALQAWRQGNPTKKPFFEWDSTNRNSGKYSLRISIPEKHKRFYCITQRVAFKKVIPGPAKLQFSMRCSAHDLKSAAVVLRGDSKTKVQAVWKNIGRLRGSFDWKTVSAELDIPADMINMEISIRIYDTGVLWIDDVFLDVIPLSSNSVSRIEFPFDGKISSKSGLPGNWSEKKYFGNENVSTVSIAKEKKQSVAVQLFKTGAPRSGFTVPIPQNMLKNKFLQLSGSFITRKNGAVQVGFEFFDRSGNSIGELVSPSLKSAEWKKFALNFKVPENAHTAAILLLNTGRAEVRFGKVVVSAGSAAKALQMAAPAISVKVFPVDSSIAQLGVKTPEFNTFTNSPTKLTFHFAGDRKRMKKPTLYLDLPARMKVADAICPHPGQFRQEKYTVKSIVRDGKKYNRYKFVDVRGMQIAKRNFVYQRRMTLLLMPVKPGDVFQGEKVFYHLENAGIKFKEGSFNLNVLPPMKKTPNPVAFPFIRWNDEDVTWVDDKAFIASLLCQEEAGYTCVSRYSIEKLKERRELMKKRGWTLMSRAVANLRTDYLRFDKSGKWQRKDVYLEYANGKKGIRYCPTLVTFDKDFAVLRDRVIASRLADSGVLPGEMVFADNEQWSPMDWCFCLRCRTEFARQQKLAKIPDVGTIRKKHAVAWREFRVEHERRLIEAVGRYCRKQGYVFGDYNYIIDYRNPGYRDRFFSIAKDARTNEKYQDIHLQSYYHVIDAAAFDMMNVSLKYLKKRYIPMMAVDGPGYLSSAEILTPAQVRLMTLSAAVTGCHGSAIYPGEKLDAKFYLAIDKAMAEIAALENFFQKGKIIQEFEVSPLYYSSVRVGKNLLELPAWGGNFRYNVREYKSQKLVSLLNFSSDRTLYVSIDLKAPVNGRTVAEYSEKKKLDLDRSAQKFIVKVPPCDARFVVIGGKVPADFAPAESQQSVKGDFEKEKKRFLSSSDIQNPWKDRDFEFGYTDINADGTPDIMIKNRKLAVAVDKLTGKIISAEFTGKKLFVPKKQSGNFGEFRLWEPKKFRGRMPFKNVQLLSAERIGNSIAVEMRFSDPKNPIELTRKWTLERNASKLIVKTVIKNRTKKAMTCTPWIRNIFGAANDSHMNRISGRIGGKMTEFTREVINREVNFPLKKRISAAPRHFASTCNADSALIQQTFPSFKLGVRYLPDPAKAVAAYIYSSGMTRTVEWHHADMNIAAGKSVSFTDTYVFFNSK